MLAYSTLILILILLFISRGGGRHYPPKKSGQICLFVAVYLVFFMGFRDATQHYGTDLNNYYRLYATCAKAVSPMDVINSSIMEPGYILLNWLLSKIIPYPQFILIIQATICIGITLRFINKYSVNITLSILIFLALGVFLFYLTGFRQSLSIACCMIALEKSMERKFKDFCICMIIAFALHRSSILFFPSYFLVHQNIRFYKTLFIILFFCIMSIFLPHLISQGNEMWDRTYTGGQGKSALGGIINLIFYTYFLAVAIYMYRKSQKLGLRNSVGELSMGKCSYCLFYVCVVAAALYAFRFQSLIIERISLYYTPAFIIFIPSSLNDFFDNKTKKILTIILSLAFCVLAIWRLSSSSDTLIF